MVDLNALVGDTRKLLRRLIGEDIDLHTAFAPDLGAVRADPGQVEQVIVNLIVNARDAMPRGGTITIETMNVELDEPYAERHVQARPGPYVLLAVTDTGLGMDAATKARLFEPFFTTKPMGEGTGLGLATVYGIVKQSDGYIWAYSEPGHGTTFKIYLPRVGMVPEPVVAANQPVAPLRGSEVVLIVEDQEDVLRLAQRMLEGRGYTVLSATRGDEALRLAQRHKGPLHLLVTDVVMPGLPGRDVARLLGPRTPRPRCSTCPAIPTPPSCTRACSSPDSRSSRSPLDQTHWLARSVRFSTREGIGGHRSQTWSLETALPSAAALS